MKKQHGFTLIEVLVAMTVFAISAVVILNATGQSIRNLAVLEEKTFASMVADNQLAMIQLQGASSTEKNGNEQMAGRTWFWTVKPIQTTGNLLRAFDVIIWNNENKTSPLLTVRTYVPAARNSN